MLKFLLGAAVAAGAYYWYRVRGSDGTVDRLHGALRGAGESIADAASTARSATEDAAGRVRDAAGS